MTESETMWDEDEELTRHTVSLARQELMLKRKAIFLEEFLRNGGMEARSVEDRCEILRQRIDSLEETLARTDSLDAARRYIEHAPLSDFEALDRDEFMAWFGGEIIQRRSTQNYRSLRNSRKRTQTSPSPSEELAVGSHRTKRSRTSTQDRTPCLRCRILKKKCDFLDQCSHCPGQSYINEGDFWKVLGCFRESLRGFGLVFCPHFSRSTTRILKYKTGGTETLNFLLVKSRVSSIKRARILHLACSDQRFFELDGSSWDKLAERQSLSIAAGSNDQHRDENAPPRGRQVCLEDYEAIWSVLQMTSMDVNYSLPTEYNLFDLIRLGNKYTAYQPNVWNLYSQAKRLLRQSVEIYLLERLCSQIASGEMVGPPPFYSTPNTKPNTLVLVDIKDDIETFLEDFERCCTGRAKLTGYPQLACLYALLVFGVAKSILVDAYSTRQDYEEDNPWKSSDAVTIYSAYKALVSCFCFSSKADVLVPGGEAFNSNNPISAALQETRIMFSTDRWEQCGYKGTKDFLLGLAPSINAQGNYNGFFVQSYGLSDLHRTIMRGDAGSHSIEHPDINSNPSNMTAVGNNDFNEPARPLINGSNSIQVPSSLPISSAPQRPLFPEDEDNELQDIRQSITQSSRVSPSREARSPENCSTTSDNDSHPETEFLFVYNDPAKPSKSGLRRGGRKGGLDANTSKKAREVRKVHSCWACWSIRMACSADGTPCDRCRKMNGPETQKCIRTPFAAFVHRLIPSFLTSQYSTQAIEIYVESNIEAFTDDTMDIEVVWDSDVITTLKVNAFIPVVNGHFQSTYNSEDGRPLGVVSLPLGLRSTTHLAMEAICLSRLEAALSNSGSEHVGFSPRVSTVSSLVRDALLSYYKEIQNKHPLLREILVLYLALRLTSRPLLLTDSSASLVLSKLQPEHPLESPVGMYSSKLLNLQLKHGMYDLSQRLLIDASTKLEKILRNRDKTLWPVSFAAVLLLCLCMEQSQVLISSYVEASKPTQPAGLEDEPERSCRDIEDGVFAQLTHIFHLRYRTHKKDWAALNPFKLKLASEDDLGFDQAAMNMITALRDIVFNHDVVRCSSLSFSEGAQHFAKTNPGRLVSTFLVSFLDSK